MAHKDQAQRTEAQRRRRNTVSGRLSSLLANARSHSKPRGHNPPSITLPELLTLWEQQQGICAYTGWQLSTETGSPQVASLDRIDNAKGYDTGNCVLVCWIANNAKSVHDKDLFLHLCRSVVAHCDGVAD